MAGELGNFTIHIHIYGKEKGEKISLIEKEKGAKNVLLLLFFFYYITHI